MSGKAQNGAASPLSTNKRLSTVVVSSGISQAHAVRLPPGTDLVPALVEAARQAMTNAQTESAFVMTAVGSLSDVTLRMAATDNDKHNDNNHNDDSTGHNGEKEASSATEQSMATPPSKKRKPNETASLAQSTSLQVRQFSEHFEVVSLVGTFSSSEDGGKHLHMSVSNANGNVLGGHLVAGTIFTTLELVLGTIQNVSFTRNTDQATGYKELAVKSSVDMS